MIYAGKSQRLNAAASRVRFQRCCRSFPLINRNGYVDQCFFIFFYLCFRIEPKLIYLNNLSYQWNVGWDFRDVGSDQICDEILRLTESPLYFCIWNCSVISLLLLCFLFPTVDSKSSKCGRRSFSNYSKCRLPTTRWICERKYWVKFNVGA